MACSITSMPTPSSRARAGLGEREQQRTGYLGAGRVAARVRDPRRR